jgi:hypothetical protein
LSISLLILFENPKFFPSTKQRIRTNRFIFPPVSASLRLQLDDASEIGIDEEIEEIQQERSQGVTESDEGAIPVTKNQKEETEGVAEWEKKR